jgi:HPt (histidine-containing phosphotransfer) domain-containing protein
MSDPDWDREFTSLRERYRRSLQEQILRFGDDLRGARDSESLHTADLHSVRQLAHRLKGTSGSYGFDECSTALAQIEAHLGAMIASLPIDTASVWDDIERSLKHAEKGVTP